MAIVVDQASLGTFAQAGGSTTVQLTTTNAVAAGGFIVLCVGFADPGSTSLSSVSGGSLSWAIDRQGIGGGDNQIAICSAQAPSGLASSTVITATFSVATGPRSIGGSSFTGVATSSALDTTSAPNIQSGTANWTSTALTTAEAGELVYGWCRAEGTSMTSTATSGTETLDWGLTDRWHTAAYRVEASTGSYSLAGTWTATPSTMVSVAAAYKAAPAGSAIQQDFSWHFG